MTELLDFTITIEQQSESRMLATVSGIKRPDIFVSKVIPCTRGKLAPQDVETMFKKIWPEWLRQNAIYRRRSLSPKLQNFYNGLVEFWKEQGRAPLHDEMAVVMGYAHRATSHFYVKELIARGWVWKDEYRRAVPIDILPENKP